MGISVPRFSSFEQNPNQSPGEITDPTFLLSSLCADHRLSLMIEVEKKRGRGKRGGKIYLYTLPDQMEKKYIDFDLPGSREKVSNVVDIDTEGPRRLQPTTG